ncbi:restriction endonuclease subunit S [Brassicibacter mesophilus]|uniref:restriction endonuclease subunit S n=1 Tax=Brassicibacter mesophilus TaxID=745119 RepID=UPI003D23A433
MDKEVKERIEMIDRGEVPKGYKETKVGIIPTDWKCKPLYEIRDKSDHYSFTGGPFGSDLKSEHYTINGIRIIQLQNIGDGKFLDEYKLYTSEEKADELIACNIYPNEIIIAKMAEPLARACIMPSKDKRYLMASDGIRLKVDSRYYDIHYILNQINFIKFRKEAIRRGTGTTRLRIGLGELKKIPLLLPEFEEQKKIGSILTQWDKVIELKEELIIKKQIYKTGVMKELLTGQKRLKGFNKEWKETKLGKVLKERKETGYEDLELLAITMANGVCRRDGLDLVDNSSSDKSKYKRILPLDIGYNTMRMWQGVSGVSSELEGLVSPAYTVLKPTDKVDSYFMGYLFKLPKVVDTFRRYSQGLVSDTLNLKYENFKGIKLTIPTDVKEQKAIAEILKLQDKEIELLKKEVALLKEQKKGLMQLLLTGKVRVKC